MTIVRRYTACTPGRINNVETSAHRVWPIHKPNTVLNICQQGELHVVERFGRFVSIERPGLYFTIPIIHNIKKVDMREQAIPIDPLMAISRDNVSVRMSGVVYLRFENAQEAIYGHYSPLYACLQHAQSAMRAAIGEMELDSLIHDRTAINTKITLAISDAATKWGIQVLRYEVTEISPDHIISQAMDRQAQAERIRREQVLKATGDKEAAILRSEGELQSRTNEAQAKKNELELHAQGTANAILLEAEAQCKAIEMISSALSSENGKAAANLELAKSYMQMMGQVGSKSNTIFFGEQAGDISSMISRISATWKNT